MFSTDNKEEWQCMRVVIEMGKVERDDFQKVLCTFYHWLWIEVVSLGLRDKLEEENECCKS